MQYPMKRLLIGTGNEGKRRFLVELLQELPIEFVSLQDLGISVRVEETGSTPEENARIKALSYYRAARIPTIASDSALCIS